MHFYALTGGAVLGGFCEGCREPADCDTPEPLNLVQCLIKSLQLLYAGMLASFVVKAPHTKYDDGILTGPSLWQVFVCFSCQQKDSIGPVY